ncbi:hypothetical protein ABFW14_04895, partial [Mycolicibacterium fortuitum]
APAPVIPLPDVAKAAKETAAQAKSTVTSATNPVSGPAPVPLSDSPSSKLPVVAAVAVGVLAVILVLLSRRNSEED